MAKFVRRAIDKIRSVLAGRRKPPVPPTLPGRQTVARGHRGVALGSQADPDLSPENVARWQTLTGDEVDDFVLRQTVLRVHSTNVVAARYLRHDKALLIEYKNEQPYIYYSVPEAMARSFAEAASKGVWVWDNLRIRGTKKGHRKPYAPYPGSLTNPSNRELLGMVPLPPPVD